jgi:succinate dehydrogenase / fumarate reductase cytochrome b subunit
MADLNRGNRPLSPHLSIYRMTITMLVSIMNRITGAGMALAGIMIVWWLMAAASSPAYFETVTGYLTSWVGLLILVGSLWALWFHFLGGLRHIVMDFGIGYEIKTVNMTGWIVLIGSFVLTAICLICIV